MSGTDLREQLRERDAIHPAAKGREKSLYPQREHGFLATLVNKLPVIHPAVKEQEKSLYLEREKGFLITLAFIQLYSGMRTVLLKRLKLPLFPLLDQVKNSVQLVQ